MHTIVSASKPAFPALAYASPDGRSANAGRRSRLGRSWWCCALALYLAFGIAHAHANTDGNAAASSSAAVAQPANGRYPLAQAQIRWLLARFITQARSIPSDAHVLSHDFLDAYHYASAAAVVVLNEYARDAAPYARMLAHERNEIDAVEVVADGDGRFAVSWTETRYAGDAFIAAEHWRALLDVGPRAANEAGAASNPFELCVRDLSWSRDD